MIEHTDSKGGSLCHPVFDPLRLTKMLDADVRRASSVISILNNVISNGTTPINEARNAFKRKQPAQAAHVVHNLKGCVLNLGGMRVFEVACVLEPKLEAGVDSDEANKLLDQLEYELNAYLAEIKLWITQNYSAFREPIKTENAQLELLKQYLLDCNILACDIFDELRPALQQHLTARDYSALSKAMEAMNFAQAMVHLTTSYKP